MPAAVPLDRVLALANPLKSWPWCCERPSDAVLQELLTSAPLEPRPVDTDHEAVRHVGRIRYLALHGWKDAIEVDVGIPVLNYAGPDWPVTDGNHRLAAAAVRGDETILVDIAGQVDHAATLLGVDEDILTADRTPA